MARDAMRSGAMHQCLTEVACVSLPPEFKEPFNVGSEAPCETLEAMRIGSMRAYPTAVARVVLRSAVVRETTDSCDKMWEFPMVLVFRAMRETARAVSRFDAVKTR